MAIHELEGIILQLATPGKGILAADESPTTMGKRLAALQIESTVENRRNYRELLFTTPGIEAFINGVILNEETLYQQNKTGLPFPEFLDNQGIVPGVKVDKGLTPLNPKEKMTQGLDGLTDRLNLYKNLGAKFAKWRAVFTISDTLPSSIAQITNAQDLARYASICQANGIVPIVEPELLIDGDHSLERCTRATEATLYTVFEELHKHDVLLECIILKPSMVITGNKHSSQASVSEVAQATVDVLRRVVPAAVPSINFLSGGQTPELATAHLNEMNRLLQNLNRRPWLLSFSYGRALQEPALKAWNGKTHNVKAGQRAFYKRAKLNAAACKGQYQTNMETEDNEAEPVFV
ncbi:MAG: class I fructose-bisphosphate aldolase [Rickettsiella sp.]|nr:class I fructose-bisphosphate aldolase [Rickettsiella sp.]